MNKNKIVDLILILSIAFSVFTLQQASSNPSQFFNFFYIRSVAAIGFSLSIAYLFRRNGISRESWLSNIFIILNMLFATFFMLHIDKKFYWMQIEKYASLFMAIPILIFAYDTSKLFNFKNLIDALKVIFEGLIKLAIGFCILWAIAYFLFFNKPEEKKGFYKLETQQQIQKLEWSSILHAKWLTLNNDHTFKIESKASKNDEIEETGNGNWTFDKESNSVTLSSNGISETFYYHLDSEYGTAYLGAYNIENSLLGSSWEALVPKENSQNDDWQFGWDNS